MQSDLRGSLEVRPQVYEAREIVAAYSVTVGTSKGTPAGAFLLEVCGYAD